MTLHASASSMSPKAGTKATGTPERLTDIEHASWTQRLGHDIELRGDQWKW